MREYAGNTSAFGAGSRRPQFVPSHSSSEYSAIRILLVDNEQEHRFLCEQELREEGYVVLSAGNGKDALRWFKESPFDLIILDIVRLEMEGIETLGKIVSHYRRTPVILQTAHPYYYNYYMGFMNCLANAFVVKSPDLSILKRTIKELLKKQSKTERVSSMQRETWDLMRQGHKGL